MTGHDEFLRAILENPADDGPRLVYADWLQEYGDPRGEFIRVQCELAKFPNPPGEANFFRRRERELARGLTDVWPWPFGKLGDPVITAEWRRGFIAAIKCNLATLIGGPCWTCRNWSGDQSARMVCGICKGDPHYCTSGCAPALFAAAPIEAITLTDRNPYWNGAGYSWLNTNRPHQVHGVPESANLPAVLWELLEGATAGRSRYRSYPTFALACAALSAACVVHGRELAGLPTRSVVGSGA